MAKKKIKYNPSFLREFIARVTSSGRQTRTSIVSAMNKDGALPGDEKEKQVTLTQLSRWEKSGRAPQLERIISLVNNYEDVSLSDFFTEDDGPIEIVITKSDRSIGAPSDDMVNGDASMLRMKLKYMDDIEAIRCQSQQREDNIRSSYEKRLSDATDTIIEQEHLIRDNNKMMIDQQRLVADLQDKITQMQETISQQASQISRQERIIAESDRRSYNNSEKGLPMAAMAAET